VKIYFLHRLTESKKSPKHKKSFLRERTAKKVHHKNLRSYKKLFYGTQRKFAEATKNRSTERSVSLPKLQKVVLKGAQCKFSAQKSFQRECRAKYHRNIRRSAKSQHEYCRNRRRRSSKDVPKGMQNLQRKVSADKPKNKR
jgi:predicted nucleotidyltransferase